MIAQIQSTTAHLWVWFGLALSVFSIIMAIRRRNKIMPLLGYMALSDIGEVFIGLGADCASGGVGAIISIFFIGAARLLAFMCLLRLCNYGSEVGVSMKSGQESCKLSAAFWCKCDPSIEQLHGIGKALPVTSFLFSMALFTAQDVTPFFTPDSKPFILHALIYDQSYIAAGILTICHAVMAVLTLWAVHDIWLGAGEYKHYANAETGMDLKKHLAKHFVHLIPLLALGVGLALMGLFGHELSQGVARLGGFNLAQIPDFSLDWHGSIQFIYGGAFIVAAIGVFNVKARNICAAVAMAVGLVLTCTDASLPPLHRFYGIVVTGIGLMVTIYSWSYIRNEHSNAYYFFLMLMFGSLAGLALGDNLGCFFAFWEVMTLASYVLIAWEGTESAHAAAKKYYIMCAGAAAFLLPGLLTFAAVYGSTDIMDISRMVANSTLVFSPGMALVVGILAIIGCGVKIGLVPGHGWLPDAHPAAPSSISAPLSGVLTKAGIFGLVQILLALMGVQMIQGEGGSTPPLGMIICILGIVTQIYGEYMALKQKDIKRLLAYSTMGQLGELTMTLGLCTWLATTGALLHLLNHAVMKDLLFLCAGALILRAGSRNLEDLRGFGKAMPFTGTCMVIGLLSIMGLPPFAAFMSKFYMLYALASIHAGLAILMLLTSLAGYVYYTRIIKTLIFEPYTGPKIEEAPLSMRIPLGILTALCVILGLFPQIGLSLVLPISISLANEGKLIAQSFPAFEISCHISVIVLFAGAVAVFIAGRMGNENKIIRNCIAGGCLAVALITLLFDTSLPQLGRLFSLVASLIGLMVTVYSFGYMTHKERNNVYYSLLLVLFGSLVGLAVSGGLGGFFLYWELMTLSSCILVAWEGTDAAKYAARKYFLMCGMGGAVMWVGLICLSSWTGTLDISSIAALVGSGNISVVSSSGAFLVALLVLVGCGAKAGLVPGHGWLPDAHPAAPSSISAPLSGVLTKAGIFGIVLVFLVIFGIRLISGNYSTDPVASSGVPTIGWIVSILGLATMLYGEYMALKQQDIKRLLAYSTMGQVGEITLTLGMFTALAAAGSLLHLINHAIMKDLLFLCSGALIMRAGSRNLEDLRGLGKAMPLTAACMVVGLISILGLPPFAGFMSKYMMIYSLASIHPLLAAMMLTASLAGVVYYTRIIKTLIFEPYTGPEVKDAPKVMLIPMIILASLCLVLGLCPKISLSLVYPVILSLAGEGKLALQPLPDLMPSFRPYTLVLMFGAILPFIFRRDKVKAGRATALVLAVAAVLVFFDWGRLDTLSLLLAFIVTIVGCINMVYAIGYMDHSHTQWRFYCFFLFMCAGLTGVAASHDLFNFFLFWEIMSSWSLYFVIVHEENADALREGFKYFFFNVLGAAFIFLAVAMLSSWVGSAEFADIHTRLPLLSSGQIAAVIILLAIGFIMKAAQLPFRIDIQMHPATAPTPVSGFISSVLLKSAIYGLIKLFLVLGGTQLLGNIASGFGQTEVMNLSVWVGGITIVMAATYAMLQKDIKLVLIYSTVSQLGYMVVGVSLGTSLGVAGGLLHLVNHVLFKDLLFLVAGAIIVRAHRQNMNQMGGLAKYMPFTMLLFAIGAACVIGIPPSNGFTSKWIIYHALMEQGYVFVAILSLVGSVLTLAYFAKVMHLAFFGAPAAGIEHTSEAPKIMLLPMAVLAAGCVLTSIFPGLVLLPINYILAEFGLETLSIAPWGLASGAGSWNATLTAILLAVVAVLGYYALKRLVGPRRFTPVHSCGIPLKELNIHPTSIDVYTAPVSALASVKTTIKSLYEKIKEPDDLKGPDNFLPEHKKTGSHGE